MQEADFLARLPVLNAWYAHLAGGALCFRNDRFLSLEVVDRALLDRVIRGGCCLGEIVADLCQAFPGLEYGRVVSDLTLTLERKRSVLDLLPPAHLGPWEAVLIDFSETGMQAVTREVYRRCAGRVRTLLCCARARERADHILSYQDAPWTSGARTPLAFVQLIRTILARSHPRFVFFASHQAAQFFFDQPALRRSVILMSKEFRARLKPTSQRRMAEKSVRAVLTNLFYGLGSLSDFKEFSTMDASMNSQFLVPEFLALRSAAELWCPAGGQEKLLRTLLEGECQPAVRFVPRMMSRPVRATEKRTLLFCADPRNSGQAAAVTIAQAQQALRAAAPGMQLALFDGERAWSVSLGDTGVLEYRVSAERLPRVFSRALAAVVLPKACQRELAALMASAGVPVFLADHFSSSGFVQEGIAGTINPLHAGALLDLVRTLADPRESGRLGRACRASVRSLRPRTFLTNLLDAAGERGLERARSASSS